MPIETSDDEINQECTRHQLENNGNENQSNCYCLRKGFDLLPCTKCQKSFLKICVRQTPETDSQGSSTCVDCCDDNVDNLSAAAWAQEKKLKMPLVDFPVEEIVGYKFSEDQRFFLIKWRFHEKPIWEKESNNLRYSFDLLESYCHYAEIDRPNIRRPSDLPVGSTDEGGNNVNWIKPSTIRRQIEIYRGKARNLVTKIKIFSYRGKMEAGTLMLVRA